MLVPEEIRGEYPFHPNDFSIDGVKMNYVDEGPHTEEVMLCLHGNPTWSFYYRNIIKHFSKKMRVIAPDHIGCGLSDTPQDYEYRLKNHIENVTKLVLQLGIKNITLVVHDWGGAIGMGFASKHPELIKRIIILNTAAFRSKSIPSSINFCRIPYLGEYIIRKFNGFAWPATFMAVKKPLTKSVKTGFLFPYSNYKNRIATAKFVQDIPMNMNHPSYQTLKEVELSLGKLKHLPITFIWGEKDFCFHLEFLKKWQEIYPDAETHILKGAGHYVIEDAKAEAIKLMDDFISKTRSKSHEHLQ